MGEMDEIAQVARDRLGFEKLRGGQGEAVRAVLDGRDTLVVMATGAGKSAIYQIAGRLIDGRDARDLAADLAAARPDREHRGGAPARRRRSTASALGGAARGAARGAGRRGARVPVPRARAARDARSSSALRRRATPRCWSWTRRTASPSGATTSGPTTCGSARVVERLGRPPVLALTATASPPVREEIVERLGMRDPRGDHPRLRPPEHPPRGRAPSRRARGSGAPFVERVAGAGGPGIVYVATRKRAEEPAAELEEAGMRARPTTPGCRSRARRGAGGVHGRRARRRSRPPRRSAWASTSRTSGSSFHSEPTDSVDSLLPGGRPRRARRRAGRGGALLPRPRTSACGASSRAAATPKSAASGSARAWR